MQFARFLQDQLQQGGFATEDVLVGILPLIRETLACHQAGQVAPLDGLDALRVEGAKLYFQQADRRPERRNDEAIARVELASATAVEVVGEREHAWEIGGEEERVRDLMIAPDREEESAEQAPTAEPKRIERAVFLPEYRSWEHALGHHDPVTDVFSLGMLLASLACGLDFHRREDLEQFVAYRRHLFTIAPGLHPVLAQAIFRMTELPRRRRPQDLRAVLHNLENYREASVAIEFDLATIPGFAKKEAPDRQGLILGRLQDRLFEISRRNRLLHFKSSGQTVNLTQGSIPLSLNVKNIRPDQILTWNEELHERLAAGETLSLNRYLNFAEALYLPSSLDRLISEARKDRSEFGFSQLRLVIAFLRWADLKQTPPERYHSPLVLLPVQLVKKKGIRDTYQIEPVSTAAEINPVVRRLMDQLYGIDLPESIDLAETDLDALYSFLAGKIGESSAAVELEKIDRPRIELIHDRARRRLDQYRRKARIYGRGVRTFLDLEYSYDPANFHPAGIKLFTNRIKRRTSRLRALLEEAVTRPRYIAKPEPAAVEAERTFYRLRNEDDVENPNLWQFDLCSLTLANFRYRKMSLVRDYEQLLDESPENPAFEATFSLSPRPTERPLLEPPLLEDRYDVVPCDPTQAMSVGEGRLARSYIIQGPPGTGKSQTITNLIADFAAQGKRVLFVCEKRAAIDVVYARLRQVGLDGLCCLIHDSQGDKKAFIQELKGIYEGALAEEPRGDGTRERLLREIEAEFAPLVEFDRVMQEELGPAGPDRERPTVRGLLRRRMELAAEQPRLEPLERERLPEIAAWTAERERIERFAESLTDVQPEGILARHPLRLLSADLADVDRPLAKLQERLPEAQQRLARLRSAVEKTQLPSPLVETLAAIEDTCERLKPYVELAEAGQFAALDPASDTADRFQDACRELDRLEEQRNEAAEANRHWRKKLPPDEWSLVLEQARGFDGNFFAWVFPAWWQLRAVMLDRYDFSKHAVAPTWTQTLERLGEEYRLTDEAQERADALREKYRLTGDTATLLRAALERRRQGLRDLPLPVREAIEGWLRDRRGNAELLALVEARDELSRLRSDLTGLLADYEEESLERLAAAIHDALTAGPEATAFVYRLPELAALDRPLRRALRSFDLRPRAIEAAAIDRELDRLFAVHPRVARYDAEFVERASRRLFELVGRWQEANAREIRRRTIARFLENVQFSTGPTQATESSDPSRGEEFKRSYNRGRRELEHEFGKSMRYKAIRDLAAGESGQVIRDLKPIWLMSPLSVSDTLPLDGDPFDVVIFDEASQITLEEAVPSLFRARQAIVVGDEMQLPPTDFFSSKSDDEEDELRIEEDGEEIEYDLAGNSFLNHAGKNLASTMLGWHYRSRSESLISFSNWAFYDGRLLTVPEEELPAADAPPLRAAAPEDGEQGAVELLSRPISFHQIDYGVYEKRRNRGEADYIAQMIRRLLHEEAGPTVGIVAFSEAQQSEIEDALERLAREDAAFRERLDAAWEREEGGQFVGLLVKNLENIQGDERDVIILSVCYGHDRDGRMLMNFGPINKSGGEKRLNVAFTRAKHHMAVVSSIVSTDITNDYNDGARCLKNYLRYAEAISIGDRRGAQQVLDSLSHWRQLDRPGDGVVTDPLAEQIADALRAEGYLIEFGVGQSHFRCDLAVRRLEDTKHRLGILIDGPSYYEQGDLLERDVFRPRLLEAFGWRIARVLATQWRADREGVLARLREALL